MIDERKDRLLRQYPVPDNVRCNTCGASMLYMNHLFRNEDTEVIFIFTCSKKHLPNKAIYSNGNGNVITAAIKYIPQKKRKGIYFTLQILALGVVRLHLAI
jgi:hypothetical protein